MREAHCRDCGAIFLRDIDEDWKIRCVRCFKKSKRAESEAADRYWPDRAAAAESLAAALQNEMEQQRRTIQALMQQQRPVDSFGKELAEHWRALVQLVHPDKHNGSPGALRITQWLNEIKGRLPCA